MWKENLAKIKWKLVFSGAKVWKSCRSRKMLKNEPSLAIGGVDTEESGPFLSLICIRFRVRTKLKIELNHPQNFERLVLGCMDSYDSERRLIFQHFSRSTRLAYLCTAQNSKFHEKISKILSCERCKMWKSCRSRKMLQNEHLVAKIGVDTASRTSVFSVKFGFQPASVSFR